MGAPFFLILLTILPVYYGDDDMTKSSQIERDEYDHKKKLEAIQGLKDELNQLPDITGQTQREGTLREHIEEQPLSKNQYWSKNCKKLCQICLFLLKFI
jgi:hypothetical protein